MSSIRITPVPINSVAAIKITANITNLNQSALVAVTLLDVNNRTIKRLNMTIEGADYQGWNEDSYLENWVLTKLNYAKLTASPEEAGTPEAPPAAPTTEQTPGETSETPTDTGGSTDNGHQ